MKNIREIIIIFISDLIREGIIKRSSPNKSIQIGFIRGTLNKLNIIEIVID